MQEKWYKNSAVMGFIGAVLGALLTFMGVVYTSNLQIKELELQHTYEMQAQIVEEREELYGEMMQSIHSLKKMDDGLIKVDLVTFKEECYTLIAKAKIYGSQDVVSLYDQFLDRFFNEHVYDSELVDNKLVNAIREDLGIEPYTR